MTPDILRRTAALALEHLLSMAADGHLEVHQEENDFKDNITIQTRSETQEWTLTQAFSKTFYSIICTSSKHTHFVLRELEVPKISNAQKRVLFFDILLRDW